MNIEKSIENCEIYLKQIKQYDPDPYYVNYFFNKYLNSINDIVNGIFEEGSRDFGLFITDTISKKKFDEKAKMKNDENAMKFSKWYLMKYNEEHKNRYPNVIKKICQYKNKFGKIPTIKLMIRASNRYRDDIYQEIKVNLSRGEIRSKEELEVEIKRQLPMFLEIINHKRKENNQPTVRKNQVIVSTFLDIQEIKNIEIAYASEIYIPVIKRLVEESRKKIKELTTWK